MIGGEDPWSSTSTRSSRPLRRARDRSSPRRHAPEPTGPPARLPALRPERSGPLREDGPQRHRVRPDAAYAEGLNILAHANAGGKHQDIDAETTPLRDPWAYQYDIDLPEVAEVWRRGSVVASWLLDLTADALAKSPHLDDFAAGSRTPARPLDVNAAVDTARRPRSSPQRSTTVSPLGARRLRRQAALGDALGVRRPRREEGLSHLQAAGRVTTGR